MKPVTKVSLDPFKISPACSIIKQPGMESLKLTHYFPGSSYLKIDPDNLKNMVIRYITGEEISFTLNRRGWVPSRAPFANLAIKPAASDVIVLAVGIHTSYNRLRTLRLINKFERVEKQIKALQLQAKGINDDHARSNTESRARTSNHHPSRSNSNLQPMRDRIG